MRQQNQSHLLLTFTDYLIEMRRTSKKAIKGITIIFGILVIGGLLIPADEGEAQLIKSIVLGIFISVPILIIYLENKNTKKMGTDSPVLQAIKYKNEDCFFTWIYPFKHSQNGVASYYIIFKTYHKKEYRVRLKSEEEFEVLNALAAVIKNVSYGFSTDLKKVYRKNPKALLKVRKP